MKFMEVAAIIIFVTSSELMIFMLQLEGSVGTLEEYILRILLTFQFVDLTNK